MIKLFDLKKKFIKNYKIKKYWLKIIILVIYLFFDLFNNNYMYKILFLNKNQKFKNKNKIVAISYGNHLFKKQLLINKKTALEVGKVDKYYSYGPNDIDKDFKQRNKDILSQKRGNGYWLWKPYFILKTLREKLNEGDYLIYTDAGILYTNSTDKIINFLNEQNSEMWMISLKFLEKSYT